MNFIKKIFLKIMVFSTLAVSLAPACTVCFGNAESSMIDGMNLAIIMLLSVITVVLLSFAAFFIYLNVKARSVHKIEGNLNA